MQPITLIFKPSYALAMLFLMVAAAAVSMLMLLPMMLWIKLILSTVVFLHAGYVILKSACLKRPNSVCSLEVNRKGELKIYDLLGRSTVATLQLHSYVSPYWTVLNLQADNRPISLLITRLNSDINAFRQLRVWLKWHKQS